MRRRATYAFAPPLFIRPIHLVKSGKYVVFPLILVCALPAQAQTWWEYQSLDDAVWTEVTESTGVLWLVRGINNLDGSTTPIIQSCQDPRLPLETDWVLRSNKITFANEGYKGVKPCGLDTIGWLVVVEDNTKIEFKPGALAFGDADLILCGRNALVCVDVHVVESRDDLPTPLPAWRAVEEDVTAPTVTITNVPEKINDRTEFTATFTFSEDVTGFDAEDVTVGGATKGQFTASSTTVYTLVLTPNGNRDVEVTVMANIATDGGNNTGPVNNASATALWDDSAPTVDFDLPTKINTASALTVIFTFSEAVTGFDISDLTITGDVSANRGSLSGSGDTYTLQVTPTNGTDLAITVVADAATDGVNTGPVNAASKTAVWDNIAPTLDFDLPTRINSTSPITVTFTFSEDVTGFDVNDLTITGDVSASRGSLSGSGDTYTLHVTPSSGTDLTITVVADAATDGINLGPNPGITKTAIWNVVVAVSLTVSPHPVQEGESVTVAATLSSPIATEVTIPLIYINNTAEVVDYNPLESILIAADSTRGTGSIMTAEDDDANDEVFTLALGSLPEMVTPQSSEEITITILDDETAAIVVPTLVTVDEGQNTDISIALSSEPSDNVTLAITGYTNTDLTLNLTELTFTMINWKDIQRIMLSAAKDENASDENVLLLLSAKGGGYDDILAEVTVTIVDEDEQGIKVHPDSLTVGEGGNTTYGVSLESRPTAEVTVTIPSNVGDVSVSPTTLIFTSSEWAVEQTVTLMAAQDEDYVHDEETIIMYASGGGYNEIVQNLFVTITDNLGVSIEESDHPLSVNLLGNYPNPLSDVTNIVFDLPSPAQISLTVIDVLGRVVSSLPQTRFDAGNGLPYN